MKNLKKVPTWAWSVLFVGTLYLVGMYIAYPLVTVHKKLKVYEPADISPRLVDPSLRNKNKDHTIADFQLVNQLGDTVTQNNFAGKIYVANFFFTTCQSICPKMSKQMERLQTVFKDDQKVMFLSHSVTPVIDSVPRLAVYGKLYHANPAKWMLCTGPKKEIYDLARKSYFAVVTKGDGGVDDFIHTENFVLIDPDRRIRGYYDGTSPDDVDKLIKDIHTLEQEYS